MCVAVGSPPPGRAAAAEGTGVHWLKGDASWVQNVVTIVGVTFQRRSIFAKDELDIVAGSKTLNYGDKDSSVAIYRGCWPSDRKGA